VIKNRKTPKNSLKCCVVGWCCVCGKCICIFQKTGTLWKHAVKVCYSKFVNWWCLANNTKEI